MRIIPFTGQKRRFLNHFKTLLKQQIPNDGDGWTIVDAFGGSGLLAHTAKQVLPKARVIYNDFDGYAERLQNINDTNQLRKIIFDLTRDYLLKQKLPETLKKTIQTETFAKPQNNSFVLGFSLYSTQTQQNKAK